jgi:hypothetical protein
MHAPNLGPRTAGYVAAAIFAVCAGVELGMVVAGVSWGAFTRLASHGVAVFLAAVWITAALAVALRDRSPTVDLVAWTAALPGMVLLFIHGFFATWSGGSTFASSRLALVYSLLAIALSWLLRRSFGRGVIAPVPQPVPWRTDPRGRVRELRPAMAAR